MIALKGIKEVASIQPNGVWDSRDRENAMILGEPIDARGSFVDLVSLVSVTKTVEPTEYVYYHTARIPTDKAEVVTTDGIVTLRTNSLVAPTLFTFIQVASNEEQVLINYLAERKEDVMARINETIEDGLNTYEIQYVVSLLAAACASTGNQVTLGSGVSTFQYQHVIQMLQQVNKYGDQYVLLMGTTCYQDFLLWEWTDNKNQNIRAQFDKIGIKPYQIPAWEVDLDSVTKYQMTATKAYLVAIKSSAKTGGKPILFVRRKLGAIASMLGIQTENGDVPERLILRCPAPRKATSSSTLAISMIGYEDIVAASVNNYLVSEFTRTT